MRKSGPWQIDANVFAPEENKMLVKIRKKLGDCLEILCALLLITITILALMQVCGRYIFSHTFFWVEEVTALLIGWMVAMGVPSMWLKGEHLSVDVIGAILPDRVNAVWNVIIQIIAVCVGIVVTYSGIRAWKQNMGYSISMLRYEESVKFYWIPVMGILLIVSAVLVLLTRGGEGKKC